MSMAESKIKNSNPMIVRGTNFRFKSFQSDSNINRIHISIPSQAYMWLNGFIITRYGQHAFEFSLDGNGNVNKASCTKLGGNETLTVAYSGTTIRFRGEQWNSFNVFYATPLPIGSENIWVDFSE